MSRWTKVSIIVSIILVGIPTAAGFYPPLFAGLAGQIPLDLILTWMERLGLLTLGLLLGWFARSIRENGTEREFGTDDAGAEVRTGDDESATVEEIEGCIEVGESCWRGTAELSNGQVSESTVAYRAICPQCQTVMYDGENSTVGVTTTATTFWECPNCDHTTIEEYSKYEDAQNLFDSDIRRIMESEGQEYSLDALIEGIDDEVTPRRIWEQYAEVRDSPQVSLNCFY